MAQLAWTLKEFSTATNSPSPLVSNTTMAAMAQVLLVSGSSTHCKAYISLINLVRNQGANANCVSAFHKSTDTAVQVACKK